VYRLPEDRLYVTFFEGDPKNNLEPDLEAKDIWLAQGVPEDHIIPGNAKDNFWGMLVRYAFVSKQAFILDQKWVQLVHAVLVGK